MAFEELDELLNTFAEADRPAMRDLLTRNPSAASALTSRQTVYSAFVEGDPARLAAATSAQPANPAQPVNPAQPAVAAQPANPTQPAAADPRFLTVEEFNRQLTAQLSGIYTSPQFTAAVDTLAERKAQAKFEAERANVIGAAAQLSADISGLYDAHRAEFGEPLNRTEFEQYYQKEGAQYANNLQRTYSAYVQQRRIQAEIDKGVRAALEARATSDVPGGAVPTTNNPIGPNFVDHMRRVGTTAQAAPPAAATNADGTPVTPAAQAAPVSDAEAAAAAFRKLQSGWQM